MGGAFTDGVSWRWCFYSRYTGSRQAFHCRRLLVIAVTNREPLVNLPLGAVVLLIVVIFLPRLGKNGPVKTADESWFKMFMRFDPVGTIILIPSIISLLLALQWGGVEYAWNNPKIIGLFVCFGVSITIWIGVQWRLGENATVPGNVITQRTVLCATLYMLFGACAFSIVVYYVPTWFQAIKGESAVQSGIDNLPLILSLVIASLVAGGLVVLTGYYVPFLYLGSVCMSVGAGLLMTLKPDSGPAKWIGYQLIFGIGVGVSLEQCNIAVQAVLPKELIASGTSLAVFARSLGGSLSIAVAENVFQQTLKGGLKEILPNLDPNVISGSGATNLMPAVDKMAGGNAKVVEDVLVQYNAAISKTFLVTVCLAALTILPALGVEWKSVKRDKKKSKTQTLEAGSNGMESKEADEKPPLDGA